MVTTLNAMVAVILVACIAPRASAARHYVDAAGGADFEAIKSAVQAASDGDTVYVASGLYEGSDNRDILLDTKNLKLIGDVSTVIDCQGVGRAFLLSGSLIDQTTLIRRFIIVNGWARAMSEDGGGGILCQSGASPIIEECTIRDCDAEFGGGIKLLGSDAVVRNSWIRDCTADYGGGIHTTHGSPSLEMLQVWGNMATERGGAIRCFGGTPTCYRLSVVLNADLSGNSAIRTDGAPVVDITNCIIAFSTDGAAVIGNSSGTIEHCIVYGNAGGDGLPGYAGDNLSVDPLFCHIYEYNPHVCEESEALHTVNGWGEYIGYTAVGCYAPCQSPVDETTWGSIKALYRR